MYGESPVAPLAGKGSTSFLFAAYPVRSRDLISEFAAVCPPRIEGELIMGVSVRWLK